MKYREINLLGGFYKDASLPWSSQDTVNWLPVPAQAEGTRSPMKLRGVPGLKPIGVTVVDGLQIIGNAPSGSVGVAYGFSYSASGGTPPYTFNFVSGSLPGGLSFSAGTISGTPTTIESDTFRIRVTDSQGQSVEKDDGIAITSASGLWILFARPSGSAEATQYSVASSVPSSFSGAKRPAVVGGQAITIEVSGYGSGWLHAAQTGGPTSIRSNDLGATWVAGGFTSVFPQQRIDVNAGRVMLANPSNFSYSDDSGQSVTVSTFRPMRERHFISSSQVMGSSNGSRDVLQSNDNGANRSFVSGFPNFGPTDRVAVNLLAGTTHIVVAGSRAGAANRFSRVPIGTPFASHTPFTVSAVSSSSTWDSVFPSIAYGNGIFVMVTDQGQIARSTDEGASWSVSSFTFPSPRSIAFGNGTFLICGNAGAIYTSTDGNSWTAVSSGSFASDNITNAIYIE